MMCLRKRIAVLGDSHARRMGEYFPIEWRYVFGVGGATTLSFSKLLRNFSESDIDSLYFVEKFYIILGTNDILKGKGFDEVASAFHDIVNFLKKYSQAAIYILPPFVTPCVSVKSSNRYISVIQSSKNIFVGKQFVLSDFCFNLDGVHLNKVGYSIVSKFCI